MTERGGGEELKRWKVGKWSQVLHSRWLKKTARCQATKRIPSMAYDEGRWMLRVWMGWCLHHYVHHFQHRKNCLNCPMTAIRREWGLCAHKRFDGPASTCHFLRHPIAAFVSGSRRQHLWLSTASALWTMIHFEPTPSALDCCVPL